MSGLLIRSVLASLWPLAGTILPAQAEITSSPNDSALMYVDADGLFQFGAFSSQAGNLVFDETNSRQPTFSWLNVAGSTLRVDQGSHLQVGKLYVSTADGRTGKLVVSGVNSQVLLTGVNDSTENLWLGGNAAEILVENGAHLSTCDTQAEGITCSFTLGSNDFSAENLSQVLTISDGGQFEAGVINVGLAWNNVNDPLVRPFTGSGTIIVDGGTLRSLHASVGAGQEWAGEVLSSGTVRLTGADSLWRNTGTVTVGSGTHSPLAVLSTRYHGNGLVEIESGARLETALLDIADGGVIVEGENSTVSTGGLKVGTSGEGTLSIRQGGRLHIDSTAIVGLDIGTTSQLPLDGSDSVLGIVEMVDGSTGVIQSTRAVLIHVGVVNPFAGTLPGTWQYHTGLQSFGELNLSGASSLDVSAPLLDVLLGPGGGGGGNLSITDNSRLTLDSRTGFTNVHINDRSSLTVVQTARFIADGNTATVVLAGGNLILDEGGAFRARGSNSSMHVVTGSTRSSRLHIGPTGTLDITRLSISGNHDIEILGKLSTDLLTLSDSTNNPELGDLQHVSVFALERSSLAPSAMRWGNTDGQRLNVAPGSVLAVGAGGLAVSPSAHDRGSVFVAGTSDAAAALNSEGAITIGAAESDFAFVQIQPYGRVHAKTQLVVSPGSGVKLAGVAELPAGIVSGTAPFLEATQALTLAGGVLTSTTSRVIAGEFTMEAGSLATIEGGSFVSIDSLSLGGTLSTPARLYVTGESLVNLDDSTFVRTSLVEMTSGAILRSAASLLEVKDHGYIRLRDADTTMEFAVAAFFSGSTLDLGSGSTFKAGEVALFDSSIVGKGTLHGRVFANAGSVIAPGNSPGTLTIDGNLELRGGSLLLEVAGTNEGEYDVLNITGDAIFDEGAIVVQSLGGFIPDAGTVLEVLHVNGTTQVGSGLTTTWSGLGADYEFNLIPQQNGAVGTLNFLGLNLADLPFLADAPFAGYLDDICKRTEQLTVFSTVDADRDQVCGDIRSRRNSDTTLAAALNAVSPDEILSATQTLARFALIQHDSLSQRLKGLRGGEPRIAMAGLNIEAPNVRISGRDLQTMAEKLTGGSAGTAADPSRWGMFADASFSKGERNGGHRESGLEYDTFQIVTGADYRLAQGLFFGAALGYNEVDSEFDTGGGLLSKGASLSLLATYAPFDGAYVDALATWGWMDADSRRHIFIPTANGTIDRQAIGTTSGDQFVGSVASGIDFAFGEWTVGPHVSARYARTRFDDFNESGAGALNVAVPDQLVTSFIASTGAHVAWGHDTSWGRITPFARADFVHELRSNPDSEDIYFVNDRFAFDPLDPSRPARVRTNSADSRYLNWTVGLQAHLLGNLAGYVSYEGVAGLQDMDTAKVSAGVTLQKLLR